jgi:hypothetical protein
VGCGSGSWIDSGSDSASGSTLAEPLGTTGRRAGYVSSISCICLSSVSLSSTTTASLSCGGLLKLSSDSAVEGVVEASGVDALAPPDVQEPLLTLLTLMFSADDSRTEAADADGDT